VTETDVRDLSITSIKALDSILGEPIKLEITGENRGNVDASPVVKVSIMDLQMNVLEVHEIANFGFIRPNETTTLLARFETNLPTGEYFVEVDVQLDGVSLRKERLVFQINNVPTQKSNEEEVSENPSYILSVGDFFREYKTYIMFMFAGILISVLLYILMGTLWRRKEEEEEKKKKSKKGTKKKEKLIPLLLGYKPSTRAALSVGVGMIIFFGLIIYQVTTLKPIVVQNIVTQKEVQGVKDYVFEMTNPVLRVFPPIEVPLYVVYAQPDSSSDILYEAKENEDFTVLDEIEEWYKVLLPNGSSGWLNKSVIKSTLTEVE
jgi:hypothetical protein